MVTQVAISTEISHKSLTFTVGILLYVVGPLSRRSWQISDTTELYLQTDEHFE